MLCLVPDVSSTCSETEKLVQSRLQHLESSWGTHHQKQVTLHWHKEISSVQTAASGQQLRYPSPEACPLHWHKEISSVQTAAPGQQLRCPHQKQVTLHSDKETSSVQTAARWQKLRYQSPETTSTIPSIINYEMNIQLLHLGTHSYSLIWHA